MKKSVRKQRKSLRNKRRNTKKHSRKTRVKKVGGDLFYTSDPCKIVKYATITTTDRHGNKTHSFDTTNDEILANIAPLTASNPLTDRDYNQKVKDCDDAKKKKAPIKFTLTDPFNP